MSFVIVSAEIAGESPHANLGNTMFLHEWLDATYGKKNVIAVHGQYRGRGEMSFLVRDVSRFEARDIWQYVNEEFDQESVLFVDDFNSAYLFFDRPGEDGGRDDEPLGTWTALTNYGLKALPPDGDWTLIGERYYQVRK